MSPVLLAIVAVLLVFAFLSMFWRVLKLGLALGVAAIVVLGAAKGLQMANADPQSLPVDGSLLPALAAGGAFLLLLVFLMGRSSGKRAAMRRRGRGGVLAFFVIMALAAAATWMVLHPPKALLNGLRGEIPAASRLASLPSPGPA